MRDEKLKVNKAAIFVLKCNSLKTRKKSQDFYFSFWQSQLSKLGIKLCDNDEEDIISSLEILCNISEKEYNLNPDSYENEYIMLEAQFDMTGQVNNIISDLYVNAMRNSSIAETAYLLGTNKNAQRLKNSIEHIMNGDTYYIEIKD